MVNVACHYLKNGGEKKHKETFVLASVGRNRIASSILQIKVCFLNGWPQAAIIGEAPLPA